MWATITMDKYINKISELPSAIGVGLSYIICINTCAFTRNVFKIILWYFFRDIYFNEWVSDFFTLISFLIMFGCGCLMGYLKHENSFFHASLAVALGVVFTYLISGVTLDEYIFLLKNAMVGAFLGGIGAGVVLILRKTRKK